MAPAGSREFLLYRPQTSRNGRDLVHLRRRAHGKATRRLAGPENYGALCLRVRLCDVVNYNYQSVFYGLSQILLTDEQSKPLNNFTIRNDSLPNQFVLRYPWKANTPYQLIFLKDAFKDSTGLTLSKNDTLKFTTKREEDYGSLKIRFNNIDLSKNPVLQLVQNELIVLSEPITQRDWYKKLLKPGSYQVRILYDANKNGKWDTGEFFKTKRQPEIVTDLNITIDIRSNWDNEKEITLNGD